MVNWCPHDQTAISDLEVKHEEVDGKLWKIRYPLTPDPEGEGRDWLEVETTRPETMLGDTALAVHPSAARYAAAVGRTAVLPLLGREIRVIADTVVDPEFGTGVVKVTPAHDPNDYEIGKRNELESIQVIGFDGRMTDSAGPYAGMDRFEARERILEHLREHSLLMGERAHRHAVGHSERSGAVIEPQISTQWFVKTAPLAEAALAAAARRAGAISPREPVQSISRMDDQYPRLVHLAPALVGPSHPGLAQRCHRRDHRHARGARSRPRPTPGSRMF